MPGGEPPALRGAAASFRFPGLERVRLFFSARWENLDRLALRSKLRSKLDARNLPLPPLYAATHEIAQLPSNGASNNHLTVARGGGGCRRRRQTEPCHLR